MNYYIIYICLLLLVIIYINILFNRKKKKKLDKNLFIKQICCNKIQGGTQFPYRLYHCDETNFHKIIGLICNFFFNKKKFSLNIDGIVLIYKKNIDNHMYYKNTYIIRPKFYNDKSKIFISDHDGINTTIFFKNYKNRKYSLTTFNLEGLCYCNFKIFLERLYYFSKFLKKYIVNGCLIILQEIILENDLLNKNIGKDYIVTKIIKNILYHSNKNLKLVLNNNRGGIIYDSSFFYLNKFKITKKMTGYKFIDKWNNNKFIIVNIHLKSYMFYNFQWINNIYHRKELEIILKKIYKYSDNFNIPTYLAGDFNNIREFKDTLIEESLINLVNK